MQFIDDRAVQRAAPPAAVGPAEGGVVVGAARAVDAERLARGARIGQRLAAVEPEAVVDAGRHVGDVRAPPSSVGPAVLLAHRVAPPGRLYLEVARGRG